MALKLSRLAHSVKLDSLTDLCGYAEGLWNYKLSEQDMDVCQAAIEQIMKHYDVPNEIVKPITFKQKKR